MAVYAAHLTRTLHGKPSIFELTAQESLAQTVKPALRKVIEFLTAVNPKKFTWLLNWYDEIYLLIDSLLQYHYVRHYAASFSETFYGLQRIPLKAPEFTDGLHLTPRQECLSLFFLIIFPFVKHKLESLAEKYRLDEEDGLIGKRWHDNLKKLYIKLYSTTHFLYETLCLTNFITYMSNKSATHSPLLRMTGVTLRYAPTIVNDMEHTWTDLFKNLKSLNFSESTITFEMLGTALLRGMEVGAFVVQFLKWWETAENNTILYQSNLPVPPALDNSETANILNKCPVCLQPWKIPTVLPISGYVFCYKCIKRSLEENNRCPVTLYPASQEHLIRLYMD